MEIVSRKENKLLNRVEINFRWQHEGQATPSRQAVMNLVKPSNRDQTQTA